MTELKEFRLPDVGEGLTEADIVAWHVKPGDRVEVNQVIVEIETAKAVVELPSPWDGTVARLLAEEGQTVDVGAPIIAVDVSGAGGLGDAAVPAEPAVTAPGGEKINHPERTVVLPPWAEAPQRRPGGPGGPREEGSPPGSGGSLGVAPPGKHSPERSVVPPSAAERPPAPAELARAETSRAESALPERQTVLVGYGVKASSTTRRPRKAVASTAAHAEIPAPAARVLAKPPVRKLAKDLGISLAELAGSGPDGSITRDDVQRAASDTTVRSGKEPVEIGPRAASLAAAVSPAGEERIPVRGVRKHMAAAVVSSAFTAPHVTEFLQVDVTETMAAVRRVRELPEYADVRVSPLLFVARALLVAVRRHPLVNSSWDGDAQEIVIKHYVNLGIAVAADRGLIVPNIKNAGELSLPELARSLHGLAETARAGKASPADLAGGTITITNVGVFGVDGGTPILTPGEAAILAFGQVRNAPWVVDGQLAVRQACTLSLSFDHRIIDGELGSAVLRDVGSMLEDPVRMLAWT
jgi:pyruvate dehydrogenase E2 component (dihydrolipoamide acetyltransferase)